MGSAENRLNLILESGMRLCLHKTNFVMGKDVAHADGDKKKNALIQGPLGGSPFGRICNSATMNISIFNARKLIGLQILILDAAGLQIAFPFGQRPLVRQNRVNGRKFELVENRNMEPAWKKHVG